MQGARDAGDRRHASEGTLPERSRYGPFLVAALLGAIVTAVTIASSSIQFAYENPPLHVAFDTAEALIASVVALVLYGRYKESCLASDLALVFALALLASMIVVFSVIPTVVLQERPEVTFAWAPAVVRTLAAAVLVVSAWGLGSRRAQFARPGFVITAAAILVLQVAGGLVVTFSSSLPDPIGDVVLPQVMNSPLVQGHPVFMALQAVNMVLLGAAAFGFGRRAARDADALMHWIAAGCVLASYSRLHYLLFPSLYTDFVYTGDFLRLAFYVLLLVGGVREIQSFWEARAVSAVAEERQRFARDLHDGAAQELLFILAQTRRLLKGKGDREDLESLESAADRAVYESRRAINALSSDFEQSLDEAVAEAAKEVSRKWGREVETDLTFVSISPDRTEHLARIAREAMTNAVKHASPDSITVGMTVDPETDAVVVRVEDDGAGFDVDAARSSKRFGMISMQERVKVLGGTVTVTSRRGSGTTVEIVVPVTPPEEF